MRILPKQVRRNRQLYLLLVVPLTFLIISHYYPIYEARIAFQDYSANTTFAEERWVGFKHFIRFFQGYWFGRIMRNTLALCLYNLAVSFPLPIILALSLNYVTWNPFKKLAQTVFYAPHIISLIIMVELLIQFLNTRAGPLAHLVRMAGIEPINYVGKSLYFPHMYVWSGIWQHTGFHAIIYLAVLSCINPKLHEIAIMDGATKIQRMWHIDLPALMPIAIMIFIMHCGQLLNLDAEKAYLLQNRTGLYVSEVLDAYVYERSLMTVYPDISFAPAAGVFKAAVGLVMLLVVNKIAREISTTSLW